MIACVAGLLLDESEKLLPPGVIGVRNEPFSQLRNDSARLWSLLALRLIPPGVGHGHWRNYRNSPFSLEKPGRCLERLSRLSPRFRTSNPLGTRIPCGGGHSSGCGCLSL